MIFLLLTILLNIFNSVIFKVFNRFGINSLQAIVANYWTCVITGSIVLGSFPIGAASVHQPWFPWVLLMGVGFFGIFNLIAYCTVKDGITTTTIANKLSLVIPVLFAIYLYHDRFNALKIGGLFLAIPAIYLSTRSKEAHHEQNLLWPALLFLGSGLLDTGVSYVSQKFLTGNATLESVFLIHNFAVAGTVGTIVVVVLALAGKGPIKLKNIIAGIILGIPNYFSIFFLVKLLDSGFMHQSAAIPVNNIGIVAGAALCAMLFFREKATTSRVLGILLSLAAIVCILIADTGHAAA